MYHLRRIKVLLAACVLACSSLFAQDVKIKISSATTDSQHPSYGPGNAIDGDYTNHWHSGNNSNGYATTFPVTFTIKFSPATRVDYVRYKPRTDSSNGNWGEVKVEYCSSTSGTSFVSVGTYDLNEAGSSHDFYLNGVDGVTCGQVRFTIESGYGGWATASEIEAYQIDNTKSEAFAQYFTDGLYTQLKSGVTSSDGIDDADVKALVEAMLADAEGYKKFRVGEYEPYMTTATVRNNLKTNSLYNNYENPTGIYLKRDESCIIAVSGIGNYPVGLKIKDWYKSGDLSTYKLHNGLNYITATTEGNVFVDYYTDDFEIAPNVQMHFINAPVLGYWDQATMTNADWESMLAGPLAEDDEVIIITRSEHAQTAYPVKQWKTYCPANVDETMTYYQQVQWAERDILGLEMFGRQVKNRQLFYADKSGSMYAGGDASVCGYEDLKPLVTPDAKVFDFWGVGHEWGHNNQMAGFHWTGCGETTNNIPASWAQFKFTGNRDANRNPTNLRLEDEVTGINDYKDMRGGRLQTYFEEGLRKGVQWQLQDGPDWHAETPQAVTVTGRDENGNDLGQVNTTWRHYDHFVKLAPFWQLNLWGTVANKNPNIIPKVIEAIRATDNYTSTYNTNGKQQINWMKLACQAAEMDLLPFFEKAGMLRPIHAYVDDYAKGWNIITEEMINELKASVAAEVEAGRYQAYPDEEINYINGHNYHIYRDRLKLNVTEMQGEPNGDKVTIQHSVAQNAVAFETYNADGELLRITMYGLGSDDEHSFTQVLYPVSFDESENAAYIMAVGYNGERQRVYQTYANEDEAKYGELGRILTGVEAMQAFCDNTKVGYYKSSALTDLNAAYGIAKAVYDKKESAKYAAVYDMLNTEIMKVKNDATARVGIVEGNAYRLTNRAYPTLSMSADANHVMIGEQTNDNDKQKWYFEGSGTEGYYYLKNKATKTYPGDVETSEPLSLDKTTKAEAHAYKLQDMGDGIWALVGATGLHCASSQSYKIVGWGADAEATQWYITVVETNTNAEALNNLQVLVDKAEALIAEIEADGAYSTISTETAQSKVDAAKDVVASGTYNASVYNELNEQYTALLNAKKSVDNAALDAKKLDLSTLIGNANSLIAQCGTVTFNAATPDTELALQANNSENSWYVSTNADHNTGTAKPDGGGILALVDDDCNTYFHTRWGGGEIYEPHYIQVDMGQGKTIQEFVFSYTPRNGSPAPTAMTIYGSNDASSFTQVLAEITSGLPAHDSGNSYTSSTINSGGAAYRYLRFVVTGSAGPGDAQYGGQYFFGMLEFDITEKAKPEGYTVTLGNEAGDVTEQLLLTAYKAVQEAQSVVEYANTEAQVNEAIEKLQEQYQTLDEAKKAVRYQDYAISALITESNVTVVGGGVVYKGQPYTTTLTAPNTLTREDLDGAIEVEGYEAMHVVVYDAEIVVTYNKGYTVQVIGGKGNGGVTYNGHDYANGETIYAPASFATSDLTAIVPDGYTLKDISIEDATVKISFSAIPLVDVTKYYTLACRATDHDAYIRDNGSVINGRSTEGSLFQFEKANDDNGYYIKSYVMDKYLNSIGTSISVDDQGTTVWTLALHSTGAMTLCIGNDQYLNNNGSADATCPYLQIKGHNGGPSESNACSLWALTESTPLDKSALRELIDETNVLVASCYQGGNVDGELIYLGSLHLTPELIASTKSTIADAEVKYNSKATTSSEYNTILTALQAACTTLANAKTSAEVEAAERNEKRNALNNLITTTNDLITTCGTTPGDATTALINEVNAAVASAQTVADNMGSTKAELLAATETLQDMYDVLLAAQQSTAKTELRDLIDQTTELIAQCGTVEYVTTIASVALQTDKENADFWLSTNAQESIEGNIANLLKDDGFFHSSWSSQVGTAHFLQVDMGVNHALKEFAFSYTTRDNGGGGPHPSTIVVSGSNSTDNDTFVELAIFNEGLPTTGNTSWNATGEQVVSASEAYRYLRFTVTASEGTNGCKHSNNDEYYFAMSKFSLTSISHGYTVELLNSNVTEEQLIEIYQANEDAATLANNSAVQADLLAEKTRLQALYDALLEAATSVQLPVTLTTDANAPVLYVIKTKRDNNPVLQYDESSGMFSVTTAVDGKAIQAFYFMKGDKVEGTQHVYIYPYMAGGKVLAANDVDDGHSKALAMDKSTATYEQWVFVEQADGYYNLQPAGKSTYLSNYGGTGNKMGFYSSNPKNDTGSLFKFEPTTVEGSYYYLKLKDYYENQVKVASSEIQGGTAVGYYPIDKVNAYNSAYSNAMSVLESLTASDEDYTTAYNTLKAANEELVINMPEVGKYYTIASACSDHRSGQLMYATGENAMVFSREMTRVKPEALWTFTSDGYLENLQTGCSVSTASTGGAKHKLGESPKKMDIKSISVDGQVLLTPNGGQPLHAQDNGSVVVGWGAYDASSASAWRIVEVEDMSLVNFALNISKFEHAGLYLNYPVTIPDGVKAYYLDGKKITIDNGVGSLNLTKIEEVVIPAKTAVILYAPQGNYEFVYAAEPNYKYEGNLFTGSTYQTYREAEGNHYYYVFGQNNGEIGLYKNGVKYDATGAEGTTHYKMSANKILFDWDGSVSNVSSFRFRLGTGGQTTSLEDALMMDNTIIYDLYGRRILEVKTSGLYIVNGEKRYIQVK